MALVDDVDDQSYENVVTDTRTDSSMVSIVCLVSEHGECFIGLKRLYYFE